MSDFYFPFHVPPTLSWTSGGRKFGAYRSKTRKHGGCDLIKPVGTPIHAVADGVLVHEETFFYHNTWYVTYQHGSILVRYGEIKHHSSTRKKRGQTIKKGEVVATVGLLSGGSHMLHIEMYRNGKDHSTLRSSKGPYMRRKDIMDPAPYLNEWVNHLPPGP